MTERLEPEQQSEAQSFLEPYIQQMGVQWTVLSAIDSNVDRPSITSTQQTREHRIAFPPGHMVPEFRCDFVHELTHAVFAEQIDPIFSTVRFDPASVEDPDFQRKAQMVYYAQMPIEVWVADHMQTVDQELAVEDIETWISSVTQIPDEELRNASAEVVVGYAVNHAQIKRAQLLGYDKQENQIRRKIQVALGGDAEKVARQLAAYYANLPELPLDVNQAIPLFEQAAQQTALILGFPIKPKLVEVDGTWVWQFAPAA